MVTLVTLNNKKQLLMKEECARSFSSKGNDERWEQIIGGWGRAKKRTKRGGKMKDVDHVFVRVCACGKGKQNKTKTERE
jgi:hypothetical protein